MNRIFIVGNLGRDPELKYTQTGTAVCELSVGDTFKYKDKSNTTWHNVQVWGKFAEICANNLSKGEMVSIVGRIYSESYEKDGQKRTVYKVNAEEVKFPYKKTSDNPAQYNNEPAYTETRPQAAFSSDDIPF